MTNILHRLLRGVLLGLLLTPVCQFAQANIVTEWDDIALQVLLAEKTNPLVQNRVMAIMHTSIFDAVNTVAQRYQPYRLRFRAAADTSAEAAIVAAAYHVLIALYPQQQALLDARYRDSLAAIAENTGRVAGLELGRQAADAMLAWRANDGADAKLDYSPGSGAGVWIPTSDAPPLAPQWGRITPWLLQSPDQFRPEPPPALDSPAYRADYAEVKAVGSKESPRRSTEQTDIARFWIQGGVPGWNPIARQLVIHKGLDIVDSARLFALLSMAAADAIIACWDAKYHYNFWRPITAIRYDAAASGNTADINWQTAVPTPPFPAYPSGHACFGGAAAAVLEAEFGSGELPELTLVSVAAPGVVRRYNNLQQQLDEISNARIWGGIHWRIDQTVGETLGRKIGNYALTNALLPAGT